jgi:hypothetical protein
MSVSCQTTEVGMSLDHFIGVGEQHGRNSSAITIGDT